jgi:arylsulfatase A-like enzyme
MLDFLRASGLGEDTIVVYASDHGDYACEHGIMEKAPGICHDAITRVPAIWWWPGHVKAGLVSEAIVEAVDVSATLCALAGLDPMETSDGRDISELLRGAGGDGRRLGVTECPWSRSVRKGRYRLVWYPRAMFAAEYPDGFGELYDLASDPWEMTKLFFDPAHRAVVEEMREDLAEWLITTTRPATILPAVTQITPQSVVRYLNAVNADGKIHPGRIGEKRCKNYL